MNTDIRDSWLNSVIAGEEKGVAVREFEDGRPEAPYSSGSSQEVLKSIDRGRRQKSMNYTGYGQSADRRSSCST